MLHPIRCGHQVNLGVHCLGLHLRHLRPVRGVGGILGTMLTGIFASNALGVFSGQEDINIGSQLGIQFLGVISVLIYTAVLTFIILKVVDAITGLRASEEQEQQGLDLVEHNESGYTL